MPNDFSEQTEPPLGSSSAPKGRPVLSSLLCVSLFATAMGFLEAICVVYLREKLFSPGTDTQEIVAQLGRFGIEHIRELCTIVMLLTVAWVAGFNSRTRTAMFFLMFGIWDITSNYGRIHSDITIGDVDNDRDMDIFIPHFFGGVNELWINQLKKN